MRPRDLFLNAALATMAWTPALSQSKPQSTPRFGIVGGANLATFAGSYFENTSNRTGFAAGLMAVLPVSPSFAIQPELMFTMKGAYGNSGGISEVANTDYIELPVLARFESSASASVKPFVYGGPGFAYQTNCTLQAQGTIEIDCDEIASQARRASPGVKFSSTDVDGIIGGGLAIDVGGRTMTVGVRYDVGFVKFFTGSDAKNRVLSFMGTLEWRFHK